MKEKIKLIGAAIGCVVLVIVAGLLFPKELGDIEIISIPKIDDSGKLITLSEVEQEQVGQILEYANFFYSSEWDYETLTDTVIANTGVELTKEKQEAQVGDDKYTLKIDCKTFDNEIYHFFGRLLDSPEKLDTGRIKFENDYYMITEINNGAEGIYIHKFQKAYDLGEGYIKVECLVDYINYDIELEEDVLTEDVGIAEGLLKKAPESEYGYYFIAYRLKVDMR